MIRTFVISAALATASVVALASPGSAQTYGGVKLSFGSGSYGGHGYDEDAYNRRGFYAYGEPQVRRDYYDRDDREYAWRAHERQDRSSAGARSRSVVALAA